MKKLTKSKVNSIKTRAKKGEIVKALQELEETKGGMLTPYDVVSAARNAHSPLHNTFEWNDKLAGDKYRLMQARILLTTVKVEFRGEKQEAFFNARVEIGGIETRGYFPIERVMSEQEIYNDVLREAIRELEHAQQKYNSLKELKGVIDTKKLSKIKKKLK